MGPVSDVVQRVRPGAGAVRYVGERLVYDTKIKTRASYQHGPGPSDEFGSGVTG